MTTTSAAPLIVATDGSSLKNPGPAAWAWFASEDCWASGNFAKATNNEVELRAVLELLRSVPDHLPLEIRADSQYVINALHGMHGKPAWTVNWRRRDWRKSDGSPVLNRELIEPIDDLLRRRAGSTTFVWVKAHQSRGGDPWNEAADARAFAAAQAAQQGRLGTSGPGYRG